VIKRRGTLFVVSAPSGAGKTTLCREMRLRLHELAYSVSVTTRAPRPGEIDGSDFRFVSEGDFRAMLARGEMAEWATVHGNLYGTPAKPLEAALRDGRDVLLDIDTQGAAQLRARYPDAVLIFVAPRVYQFAVVGDQAIHEKCGEQFWQSVVERMRAHFQTEKFSHALVEAIQEIGSVLARHFPKSSTDKNELPNEIAQD